ncbi:GRAS [Ancistrocladus abbreviatus]
MNLRVALEKAYERNTDYLFLGLSKVKGTALEKNIWQPRKLACSTTRYLLADSTCLILEGYKRTFSVCDHSCLALRPDANIQEHQNSGGVPCSYHQPAQEMSPYWSSHFQIVGIFLFLTMTAKGLTHLSTHSHWNPLQQLLDMLCMILHLLSAPHQTEALFLLRVLKSYISDPRHSSENTSGSPISWCSGIDDDCELKNKLRKLEISLLGPEPGMSDSNLCRFNGGVLHETGPMSQGNRMMEMISRLDLKQVLILCAEAVSDEDWSTASSLMDMLGHMVSVSGSPIERLAAYMLEGLRARVEYSGYTIYRKLRCDQPTNKELLSYMHILYLICPYYKFAYLSSNVVHPRGNGE